MWILTDRVAAIGPFDTCEDAVRYRHVQRLSREWHTMKLMVPATLAADVFKLW